MWILILNSTSCCLIWVDCYTFEKKKQVEPFACMVNVSPSYRARWTLCLHFGTIVENNCDGKLNCQMKARSIWLIWHTKSSLLPITFIYFTFIKHNLISFGNFNENTLRCWPALLSYGCHGKYLWFNSNIVVVFPTSHSRDDRDPEQTKGAKLLRKLTRRGSPWIQCWEYLLQQKMKKAKKISTLWIQ